MNLGETILRLRTGRGMSQEDLAAALEVSRQSVSKWETNASVPELDKLVKLSALFGVTLDELVTGEEKEPPPPAPPADPPQRESSSRSTAQTVIGWILMGLAAAVCLCLTMATLNLAGVLFALPFLACGTICLTVRRNAGLWCAWVLLACVDLFLQFYAGVSWSMILLPQAYAWGMYAQLSCAWGEALFTAALLAVTAVRFRKHPVKRTGKKRKLLVVEMIALVLLSILPYWITPALPILRNHLTAYRILIVLLSWARLTLLTVLLTALAQGVWKKAKT